MQLPEILVDLKQNLSIQQPLYLVGGAVRDYLLGKPCVDYDIVCTQEARKTARKFADQTGGAFFALDEVRKTYRVLINQGTSRQIIIDFASVQGDSIEEDLAKRDFTINAMAVDLDAPQKIIDPHKGGRDLQEKNLRPVSAETFTADPLRVIRAVRYAVNLGLKINPESSKSIRDTAHLLDQVSKERKRDELFKIFDGVNVHTSLLMLHHFQIFPHFPLRVADDFSRVLGITREMEELLGWITGINKIEKQAAFHQVSLVVQLGRFKEKFQEHFLTENSSGRTRKALLYLTTSLSPGSGGVVKENIDVLTLSSDEIRLFECFQTSYHDCERLISSTEMAKDVEIYEFFKAVGSSGVDLVIFYLAQYQARLGIEFSQDAWLLYLRRAEALLQAWWERPDLIHPVPLLNGNDIMQFASLGAGPIIGEIIDELIRQQIDGMLTTKKQALDWLALQVNPNGKN